MGWAAIAAGMPVRHQSMHPNMPLNINNTVIHSSVNFPSGISDMYPVGEGMVIAVPLSGQD
jgi:hypothetical protein